MREFPDDSECLLREDSESVGTGKTHGLCGGRALRKCSEKRCRSASSVLFDHSSHVGRFHPDAYTVSRSALAQVGLPRVNALDWMKALLG